MGRYFSSTQSRTAWRIVFSSSLNRSSMRTKSTPLKTAIVVEPPGPGKGKHEAGRGRVDLGSRRVLRGIAGGGRGIQPDGGNLPHRGQRRNPGRPLPPIGRGGDPESGGHQSGEVALVGEAGFGGDLRDGLRATTQPLE